MFLFFLIRSLDKKSRYYFADEISSALTNDNNTFWRACGRAGLTPSQVAAAAAVAELVHAHGVDRGREIFEACGGWRGASVAGTDAPWVSASCKRAIYLWSQAHTAPRVPCERIPAPAGMGASDWVNWSAYADGIASTSTAEERFWAARAAQNWLPPATVAAYQAMAWLKGFPGGPDVDVFETGALVGALAELCARAEELDITLDVGRRILHIGGESAAEEFLLGFVAAATPEFLISIDTNELDVCDVWRAKIRHAIREKLD